MKRETTLIALLAASALVLAILVAVVQPQARADTISNSRHFILLTSSSGNNTPDLVSVLDESDGVLLQYTVQNQRFIFNRAVSIRSGGNNRLRGRRRGR